MNHSYTHFRPTLFMFLSCELKYGSQAEKAEELCDKSEGLGGSTKV